MAFALLVGAAAHADERYSAIVVDAGTGRVIHGRDIDVARRPASLTKLMTLYMVFEALEAGELALNEAIPVSARAAAMPETRLGLRQGDAILVHEAISALIVRSANDVAVAVGEHLAGSEADFGDAMTERARELGLVRTRFANASGLPDSDQVTTARDMALLSQAIIQDFPHYYEFFSQREFEWRGRTIHSHNHIIDQVDGADGLKTGYINASGYNLAASAQRGDVRVIAVVLGGPSAGLRDDHMSELLNSAFDAVERHDVQAPPVTNREEEAPLELLTRAEPAATPLPLDDADAVYSLSTITLAPPLRGRWAIQIGAFPERDHARDHANALLGSGMAALSGAVARVSQVEADTQLWRAQCLGFANVLEARSACAAARTLGSRCFVVEPAAP